MKFNLRVSHLIKKGFSLKMKNEALEHSDPTNKLVVRFPLSKNMTFKALISSTEVQ